MDNDLNVSGALAAVFEFMTSINKIIEKISKQDALKIKETMLGFDSVLRVMDHDKLMLTKDIEELVAKRETARKNKDFATSDKIRDELKSKGIILEDSPNGVRWKKID
jgi:cysteinyl-tRNA synthetase